MAANIGNADNSPLDLDARLSADATSSLDGVGGVDDEEHSMEDHDDKHDDKQNDNHDGAKDDGINHRVSLTYHNKLQLLKIFVQLRPLYLDPTVSKTLFWKRVNQEISQVLAMPFKSSVYTVKRLVKRRHSQLEHYKQHPSTAFRKVALDELVDMVIAIFEEEKSKKRKNLDSKKALHSEKENMRKSMLANKLVEESVSGSTSPHLSNTSSVLPMESFTNFLQGTNKITDPSVMASHMNLGPPGPGPMLSDVMDSINHLQASFNSDARYETLALEIKSLRESTFAELRNINNKLDLIYSVLSNKP